MSMISSDKAQQEKRRLAEIATTFSMGTGFNGKLEKYRVKTILDHSKGPRILDVGCADGFMSRELAPLFPHVTAIDGSEELIQRAKDLQLSNVDFQCVLFEEFQPTERYDTVILSDILEHVDDAVLLLQRAREWVKDDGRVVALCPNANSIHRWIGVYAGMINDIHDLNSTDISVGHRRVYDIQTLTADVEKAGLRVQKWGGMFLKPLSNVQMDALDPRVVDAFYEIGERLPQDLLTEIYVECGR